MALLTAGISDSELVDAPPFPLAFGVNKYCDCDSDDATYSSPLILRITFLVAIISECLAAVGNIRMSRFTIP